MKKKFRLWLNIVTICLCICAIAIGVYAATSATLTVQGQIGFTAHGCDIDASGYVYGHAAGTTVDEMKVGLPTVAPTAQDGSDKVWLDDGDNSTTGSANVAKLRNDNNNTASLDIGDRYFTDMNGDVTGKPTDIVVVLTLTNQSLFDVYGVVSATSDSDNIGITKSAGLFNLDKKVVNGEETALDSVEMVITLSIFPDAAGNYNSIENLVADNVHISIDFNKGTIEDKLIKGNATDGYYLEMGTHTYTNAESQQVTEPLKWYAFAYKGTAENATYGSHAKTTALTSGSYYFISEKALLMTGQYSGKAFNSKTSYENAEAYKKLEYAYESTIQPLVNGQDDGSVYDTYGMANSPIYNAITNRDLVGEEYNYNGNTINPTTQQPYTTRTAYNQTLWLLSKAEVENPAFFADANALKVISVSDASANSTSYSLWWLRSPEYVGTDGGARSYVVSVDRVNSEYVNQGVPGVRPGFQLDIAM